MDYVINLATAYVKALFALYMKPSLRYHSLSHTMAVVNRCIEMSNFYSLPDKAHRNLVVAAWFHDTGHLVSGHRDHEKVGVGLMHAFFVSSNIPPNDLDLAAAEQCIMATKWPPAPVSTEEMIICDADTYHLGTPEFFLTDRAVREEFSEQKDMSDREWKMKSLKFLEEHTFFTAYCQQLLNAGKQANIETLRLQLSL
ncbi:MAG: HD domain-containing protein [Filimonas sp.]|nr:HD domain-containing protein [Filimonas sp.]